MDDFEGKIEGEVAEEENEYCGGKENEYCKKHSGDIVLSKHHGDNENHVITHTIIYQK